LLFFLPFEFKLILFEIASVKGAPCHAKLNGKGHL